MDLSENPQDVEFRLEVRQFLATHMPAALRAKGFALQKPDKNDLVSWQRILFEKGWGAPAWSKEFGGTGWSVNQQLIFEEETFLNGGPRYVPQINMIGPVLQRFGTKAQQDRFLPRLIKLEDWWCQGYSEPGAGSDLTSLRTQARRDGDHYVVTGQKIWTSTAHWADWMFALVRTSNEGKAAAGISFLLIDMKSPGIRVNAIKGIDGAGTLAEVFLDEVRVPCENLVHEENQGWTVAKYLLGFERSGQAALGQCKFFLELLRMLANTPDGTGACMMQQQGFQQKFAEAEISVMAHEWTLLRMLSSTAAGPQFSMLKNCGALLQQQLSKLMLECSNTPTSGESKTKNGSQDIQLPDSAAIAKNYLDFRKVTIFAGTTEIQKNIIAKSLLGTPSN
ncbi:MULTISPECIES: acyl-CoA dehydrogenase family protein [Polaromonas]|uniref:Acyl-CoA dehydrogenase family protein n=1 Tax=Polaromonas aquatica TaxID=332657 RepID=A0ABW1U4M4_9BURK